MKRMKESIMLLIGLGLVVFLLNVVGIGCPLKWLTGISCPGCGLTRAVFCVLQFEFGDAFHYHPLFWVLPFILIVYLFQEKIPDRIRNAVLWITAGAFLVVYVIRMLNPEDHIVEMDIESGIIVGIFNFIR